MPEPSISVALCTFNGEGHLREQLESIAHQTRRPGEVVVYDDASTDGTVGVAEAFARGAPFPVRVHVNESRVGSTANFDRAVAACAGELIALADQDDAWMPGKLEALAAALGEDAEAVLAFSDAEVVDDDLRPLGYTLWQSVGMTEDVRRSIEAGQATDALLVNNYITGATLLFRSTLRPLLQPFPPGWVHDGWIALLASAVGRCVPVEARLVRYRQHASQQVGVEKRTLARQIRTARTMDVGYFRRVTENWGLALARLRSSPLPLRDPGLVDRLSEKIEHCRTRLRMRTGEQWRVPLILGEAWRGRYGRYSLGWKSIAQDLFM